MEEITIPKESLIKLIEISNKMNKIMEDICKKANIDYNLDDYL